MSERVDEIEERLARLTASGNGASSARFEPDDLDWFLFHSFPGGEIDAPRLAKLLPVYERAIAAGATFDFELLYVRALELSDAAPAGTRETLARTALARALADRFDPADAIATLRFAVRVLPEAEALDRLLADAACERLRFCLTADFTLDERELDDYLAISYLREGDPDAGPVLARFPVPPRARARLAALLEPDACRRRLAEGFAKWTEPDERSTLRKALAEKLPGFSPST